MTDKKEDEVPDRISSTYFETEIHKLRYIKHTYEGKLVSAANDGLAAVELHGGYQKLLLMNKVHFEEHLFPRKCKFIFGSDSFDTRLFLLFHFYFSKFSCSSFSPLQKEPTVAGHLCSF